MDNDNIEKVIKSIKLGDFTHFKVLVDSYTPILKLIGQYYLNSIHDIEDVIQEVWIKVSKYIDNLRVIEKFPSWITKIMKYTCISYLKKHNKKSKKTIYIDLETRSEFITRYFCAEDNCWKNIENKNLKKLIKSILDKIPEIYSFALKLYYLDGLRVKNICELLNLPESTIKWRLYQGRLLFKKYATKILKDFI